MNALPAYCNALPMHSRYANERTPSALQRTSDMLMNALPTHSSALQICKWAHFQRTPNALPAHFFLI